MSNKQFLELLCKTSGLYNIEVKTYRTNSADGMYAIAVGYYVNATNENGENVVHVETPEGFKDAVYEVMKQIYNNPNIKHQ